MAITVPNTAPANLLALQTQITAYQAVPSTSLAYGDAQNRATAAQDQLVDSLLSGGHVGGVNGMTGAAAILNYVAYTIKPQNTGSTVQAAKVVAVQAAITAQLAAASVGGNVPVQIAEDLQNIDLPQAQYDLYASLLDDCSITAAAVLSNSNLSYIDAANVTG